MRYQTAFKAIAIVVFGTFAFSVVGYSFAAAQNVTSTAPAPTGSNVTGGNVTGGNVTSNQTTTASEADSFLARGQIAGMISDEILGGRFKIDVKDGQGERVEVNMTMAKPDGNEFHTMLIDNFTAGGVANETTVSNATGVAGAMTSGNATGGNATMPSGNETTTAGTITLSQDGTFEISGTTNIYMNNELKWESVPITIEGNGRTLTIEVDSQATDSHFGGQPIYGFVTALLGRVDGGKQSFLPPLETETPTGPPMPVEPNNGTGATNNTTTSNATSGDHTGGGGGTQVSITSGSQSKTTDAFDPNPVQVKVGDTVTWINDDSTRIQ